MRGAMVSYSNDVPPAKQDRRKGEARPPSRFVDALASFGVVFVSPGEREEEEITRPMNLTALFSWLERVAGLYLQRATAPLLDGEQIVRLIEVVPAILMAAAALAAALRASRAAEQARDEAGRAHERAAEAVREQVNFALRAGRRE